MAALRAVIVTIPPLLRDMIRELSGGALEVVANLEAREGLEQALATLTPDLVMIGLGAGEPDGVARRALEASPASRVIAIANGGHDVYLHEMRPFRRAIPGASLRTVRRLINGLRARV